MDVFGFRRSRKIKPIPERKFIRKAQNIFRLYNINENLDPGVIPTYPEADLEDKHYIVDFLSNVIANLDSNTSLNDDFNRFGVKLVIFGGCMELARFRRLNIAQANSLLNEAFSILDGKNYEVAEFYEAKRSYQDNRVAVFLTGVGAYLMYQLIRGENLDKNILRLTFYKWRQQNILQRPDPVAVIEKQRRKQIKRTKRPLKSARFIKAALSIYIPEYCLTILRREIFGKRKTKSEILFVILFLIFWVNLMVPSRQITEVLKVFSFPTSNRLCALPLNF